MKKRKRLFTPSKYKVKTSPRIETKYDKKDVTSARGRFKGVLKDILEPAVLLPSRSSDDESEKSSGDEEYSPHKHDKSHNTDSKYDTSDDEGNQHAKSSYVLKLFDRSVDLSQFSEDSPLYPICRAWIQNQPKANYQRNIYSRYQPDDIAGIELPGPDGPPVSKIPPLLPEQLTATKHNINLDYTTAPPPSREQLLRSHAARWNAVRYAWLQQANKAEARYEATQKELNKMNVEFPR